MLRFNRPNKPPEFAASVHEAELSVHRQVTEGAKPTFDEVLWKRHKSAFIEAQYDKCGYCETFAINHPGAVEHYAPKGQVDELVAEGREEIPGIAVRGRETPTCCSSGYWWLAYSWENWLFACERCNTGWKRSLFPIRESPRALPPRPDISETALLLHPFGNIDPVEHLAFSRLGQIYARDSSEWGTATIKACGLWRESLRRVREPTAERAHLYAERLIGALLEGDFRRARDASGDLLVMGAERCAHAGMVRAIVRSELQWTWDELQRRHGELESIAVDLQSRQEE